MKKVLFIANSDRHILLCHIKYMKMFKDNGYIVHVATNSNKELPYCDKKINLHLKRNPYSFLNFFATHKVRQLVKKEDYSIISCHTPIGGFLGRSSVILKKRKPIVIYTAHGFHFYKGASIINWLIYYPIEKFLSRYTDALITMNEEDYNIAKNKFHCDVYKINGIGLDKERLKITNIDLKKKLNIDNKYIVTYIAEISKRKNQLKFLKQLKKHNLDNNIVFLFIGDSTIKNIDKKLSKYKNVKYIPFQKDIGDYINISDLIISPSKQEGLPQNILEAMYYNKVIVALNIRGVNDLLKNGKNGYLVNSLDEMIDKIQDIKQKNIKTKFSNIKKYELPNTMKKVKKIINNYISEKII